MASAAKILGQAHSHLLESNPGSRSAVHMRAKLTIGASGAPTVVAAATTVGVTVSQSSTDGIYTFSFPAGRDMWGVHIDVWPAAPETVTEGRKVNINSDSAVTAPAIGTTGSGAIEFYTAKYDGTEDADLPPVSGSEIHADWWMDYA